MGNVNAMPCGLRVLLESSEECCFVLSAGEPSGVQIIRSDFCGGSSLSSAFSSPPGRFGPTLHVSSSGLGRNCGFCTWLEEPLVALSPLGFPPHSSQHAVWFLA